MSLARKAVRGAAFTIATSAGSRVLGMVGMVLIVRYLLPADYGAVTVAFAIVATANQMSVLGVGMYIIANPKAGRDICFHATLLHLFLGAVALTLVVLVRNPLGAVFAPTAARYFPGLALAMVFDRVSFMPQRILAREMRFGILGLTRTVADVVFTVVSVGTAMAGVGAMSIVIGNIARSAVRMLVAVVAVKWRTWIEVCALRFTTLKMLASYGLSVSLGALADFAARRWDNLLVSRYFGPGVLGFYNLAYNLAEVPAVQVGEQATDVLLSTLAHVDESKRKAALLRSTALLGLIMFPLAAGLGAVAPTAVKSFLKPDWWSVGPMLVLLSGLSIPRPISGAVGAYLQVRNRPNVIALLAWINVGLLVGGITLAGRLGPLWACAAVGATFCLYALANLFVVQFLDGVPVGAFLRRLGAPLVACLPMMLAVQGLRLGARALDLREGVLLLVAEILVGGAVYVGAAFLVAREASRDLLELLKDAWTRRRQASTPAVGATGAP